MFRVVSVCWPRSFCILSGVFLILNAAAQTTTVSVTSSADTFLRASAPTLNYGGAGAIAISGSRATNASGQTNGIFDSLIRFPGANIISNLDAALGPNNWLITRATLHLIEIGMPPSPLFNRGVGNFEIRWVANDNWAEGTGNPAQPTTNGARYQDLPTILNPAADISLGQFANAGVDGSLAFPLALAAPFVSDLRAGADVTMYLTALTPFIGFTADSHNNSLTGSWPTLEIGAASKPNATISSIVNSGAAHVTISFTTVPNWVTILQAGSDLTFSQASNLLTVPSEANSMVTNFVDTVSGGAKFYRLVLTQ